MKSLSDIQDQKQRHRSSVKTEDGFYVHYLGKNYWFGEVFVEQLNGHHETFEAQFIKLIISGEMPIGPESHQDSWFWSNKQLFSDGYCERPCILEHLENCQLKNIYTTHSQISMSKSQVSFFLQEDFEGHLVIFP